MKTRTSLVALLALASATAAVPTSASAHPSRGGCHNPRWCGAAGLSRFPSVNYRYYPYRRPVYIPGPYIRRPAYVPVPVPTYVPTTPTYVQPAPAYTPAPVQPSASQNCNCLSKSYLQDGTVAFYDRCTNETASTAPQPQGGVPQQPQAGWPQQGGVPQQPQAGWPQQGGGTQSSM